MPLTPNFDLPYPLTTDPATVPADIQALAEAVDGAIPTTPIAASKTVRVPIMVRNAQQAANAGNAYPAVLALTAHELWTWAFKTGVDGKLFGVVAVPKNLYATPAAKIVLDLAWSSAVAGNARMSVAWAKAADGATVNPGSLTAIAAQDVAAPGTAYLRKLVTFTLATQPSADDLLLVSIFHEGAHANDTQDASATYLLNAYLECAVEV